MTKPRKSKPPLNPPDEAETPAPSSMGPPPVPSGPQLRRSTRVPSRPANQSSDGNEAVASSRPPTSRRRNAIHKRNRSEMIEYSDEPSTSSKATGFSASTKFQIEEEQAALECWHCGSRTSLEIAHVIAGRERELFDDLKHKNRLNLEHIHHKDNGVQLCVACHRSYDNPYPAWVFIPTNLEYFITYENNDFARRTRSARTIAFVPQQFPPRQCPSVQQYLQRGGLYRAYLQRNYFFRNVSHAHLLQPGPSPVQQGPARWHGDPMAALNRGFKMVGVAPEIFPDEISNSLMSLNRLYGTHDRPPSAATAAPPSSRPGPGSDGPGDHDHDHDGSSKKPKTQKTSVTPVAKDNAKKGQAVPQKPSDTGGCKQHQNPADLSGPRRSSRIQGQLQRQAAQRRRKEQERVRRMLEDPPDKHLRREITEGIWKWGPLSSSHDAMKARMQTGEQKSPTNIYQYRRSLGLLTPNTAGCT
ncbi:MAG: hypothetical protein Q9188_003162 [Gyalolechia gomerana]